MARRLPIFFVVDCSESMVGKPIADVERAFSAIIAALRSDPHAIETAYVGVIAFSGISKPLVRLTELMDFQTPTFPIGAGTNLGAGLVALMAEIDASVVQGTPERKGDWKPVVYLMSDGRPTTDARQAVEKWQKVYARRTNVVGIGFGADADLAVLQQVCSNPQGVANVFSYDPSKDNDMKAFVRWISQSVSTQSAALSGDRLVVAPVDGEAFRPAADVSGTSGDDQWVTVVARCGLQGTPFVARYVAAGTKRNPGKLHAFEGAYALAETYIEWSGSQGSRNTVGTDQLDHWGGCPVCRRADRETYSQCKCGGLFCTPTGAGTKTCPWCKATGEYREVSRLDIGRGIA